MIEKHLGYALELATDWLMVLEGDRIIYSNHGLPDVTQLTGERSVGRKLAQVLPPGRFAGMADFLSRLEAGEGEVVTVDVEGTDELAGPFTLVMRGERRGAHTYVSVRRRADQEDGPDGKLMEVEDKLSALLSVAASAGVGVGVFEISPEGELLPRSFNEHVTSIFNKPQEEMVGHNPIEWMHPDDRPIMEAMVEELRETGANRVPVQMRAIDSTDEVVHIQVANSMLSPPNDRLGVSFIQDLTPMREALDAQNRMVQAIERVEDTVVLADAMGRIFYANPAALRNSGYNLEEVVGQPISMFAAPEGVEGFADKAMIEFLRRGWWRGNTMASTKDGQRYPVEVVGSAVRNERGELSMIVVISRKTMERQHFEAQLLMARSNNERLLDHLEQSLLPGLERSYRNLSTDAGGDREAVLEDMRTILREAREVVAALPPLEEAQTLRPIPIGQLLSERLPHMVSRLTVDGEGISVDVRAPEEGLEAMANDMLPDLVARILEVLTELAEFARPDFTVAVGSRDGDAVEGELGTGEGDGTPVPTVSITCPGLHLTEELEGILIRQELTTRGELSPAQALAVEASQLLLFIYDGRIVTKRGPRTGEESVVVLLRSP